MFIVLLSLYVVHSGSPKSGIFFQSGPLIARHYAGFVTGNLSLAVTLTMLLVPLLVSYVAPDNSPEQWRQVKNLKFKYFSEKNHLEIEILPK